METEQLFYFTLLALLAEILGTIGGFGSSLFFVPIASYFLDFHSVLGITALFHVSSNVFKIVLFKKGVDRKLVLSMGIPAVIFVTAGAFASRFIPVTILEIFLALFLITISIILWVVPNIAIKPSPVNASVGGILSGFIAGLVGTGGAIRGIALASFNYTKDAFIATSAFIDLGVDISRSIVYLFNGYIWTKDLYLVPILLLVSVSGTFIGKKILQRVSEKQFKSFVLIMILATGITTLISYLQKL